jgi:hypothetical protein
MRFTREEVSDEMETGNYAAIATERPLTPAWGAGNNRKDEILRNFSNSTIERRGERGQEGRIFQIVSPPFFSHSSPN